MKLRLRLPIAVCALLALAPAALRAQWQSSTYTLRGGWNSIFLHGDLPQGDVAAIFADHPEVLEVWRWNPNPTQTQFEQSPLIPSVGTPEWSRWQRSAPEAATLHQLSGQAGYLVRCAGPASTTYSIPLLQKIRPPANVWMRNGASFLGFPSRLGAGATYPLFSGYFATFPAAIAANTRIYKYVGGDLGPANPVQVFSPSIERLDRNQAYWFEAQAVGGFHAPAEFTLSNPDGLHYGRTGSVITVRVRNRASTAMTLTIAPVDSAAAPVNQTGITGPVPLTRRSFDAGGAAWTETAITGAYNETVPPSASIELSFGIDRSALTGSPGDLHASLLRFTDGGNLFDVYLPASAQVSSLAGLWVGDVTVSAVNSLVPGSPGATTAKPFTLRTLLHVDNSGTGRLLSQVFMGALAAEPHPLGLSTREAGLDPSAKASATRLVAAHLPLDLVAATGSGSVALGGTLVRSFTVAFNDPTNPFVHTYHPDHDNRDARFQPLPTGRESYDITRECRFDFATTPPAGVSTIGWGGTVLAGTYTETFTGLHRQPLVVTGTFVLRRASELGELHTD